MLVICPKKLLIGTEISGFLFTSLSNHNDYGDGNDDYGDNDDDGDDLGNEPCLRSSKILLPYHEVLLL